MKSPALKDDPKPRVGRLALLLACVATLAVPALAQSPYPERPSNTTTEDEDRRQMMWQVGFQSPVMGSRLVDPNRPPNGYPVSSSNPEGNWRDAINNTVVRSSLAGLWVTYDTPGAHTGPGAYGFGTGDNLALDGWQYTPIDLLKMKDGTPVTTPADWFNKRRPELLEGLRDELYGRYPDRSEWPAVTWVLGPITTGTANGVAYVQRTITGNIDTSSYPALRNVPRITGTLRIPAAAHAAGVKVPVIIALTGTSAWQFVAPYAPGQARHTPGSHGYGVCAFTPTAIQPDNGGASMSSYLIGLFNKGAWRKPTDIGALGAWAWGISRLVDFFETPTEYIGVNPRKLGVEGVSRYGKAAAVAMAYDDRLLAAYPASSGAGGAKMMRRHWGENIENLGHNGGYHWMAGNLFKWCGPLVDDPAAPGQGVQANGTYKPRKLELMSVDGHALVAMAAPRLVMLTAGNVPSDAWVDARGAYLAGVNATPVYELLGRKGLVIPAGTAFTSGGGEPVGGTPAFNTAFIDGHIGWRRQTDGHTGTPGYPAFVQLCSKFFDDVTPPEIGVPANLSVLPTSAAGAAVNFDAPLVLDAVDQQPQVTVDHASGSVFPIGTTIVTATSTDISGNTATESFSVTVTPFTVVRGGYSLNRRTNQVTQQVTLKNVSSVPISGPVHLVLESLSSNTTLQNASGTTGGNPYIVVTTATVVPGASVSVVLQFANPATGGITYEPQPPPTVAVAQ